MQFIIFSYEENNDNIPTKMPFKTKVILYVEWWKPAELKPKWKNHSIEMVLNEILVSTATKFSFIQTWVGNLKNTCEGVQF